MKALDELRTEYQIPDSVRLYNTDHFMIYVGIETRKDSQFVTIYAPLYVNKVREFSVSYSLDFSDANILKCYHLTKHLANSYR